MLENTPHEKSSRSKRTMLAVGFLMSVILMLIVLIIMNLVGGKGKADEATGSEVTTSQSTSSINPSSSFASCSVESDGSTEQDMKEPADLVWKISKKRTSWPSSAQYGPVDTSQQIGQCFTHTPMGAVLAVANVVGSFSDPQFSEEQLALLLTEPQRVEEEPRDDMNKEPSHQTVVVGYTIEQYTDSAATIGLVSEVIPDNSFDGSGYFIMQCTVEWDGNDWKYPVGGCPAEGVSMIKEGEFIFFTEKKKD